MALMKFGMITSTFMGAMDQEKKLVISRAIFGSVNIALNLLFIPIFSAFGALLGTAVAVLAGLVYETSVVQRCLRPRYPLRFLARMTALSLASGAVALLLKRFIAGQNILQGTAGSLLVLAGAGLPWLGLTVALFIALRPFSPQTVEVVEKVPLPLKRWLIPLLRARK
jgi:O-antigen/teichoic acid export membrane protein